MKETKGKMQTYTYVYDRLSNLNDLDFSANAGVGVLGKKRKKERR